MKGLMKQIDECASRTDATRKRSMQPRRRPCPRLRPSTHGCSTTRCPHPRRCRCSPRSCSLRAERLLGSTAVSVLATRTEASGLPTLAATLEGSARCAAIDDTRAEGGIFPRLAVGETSEREARLATTLSGLPLCRRLLHRLRRHPPPQQLAGALVELVHSLRRRPLPARARWPRVGREEHFSRPPTVARLLPAKSSDWASKVRLR